MGLKGRASGTVAEALILASIAVAPWPYGSATDVARYTVASILLLAISLWAFGRARGGEPLPWLTAPAFSLFLLALAQAALGRSVARVFTLEAAALLAAMGGVVLFWSERGRDRDAARRLVLVVLATCCAQAVFGAVQWSMSPTRIYGQESPYVTTPFGSYVNHNHFAGLIGMGAVLAAGLAVAQARRRDAMSPAALVGAGVAVGLVTAHLASRSRGGLVALVCGLVALAALWMSAIALRGGRRRVPGILAAVAVMLVLAFAWAAVPGATRGHLSTVLGAPKDGSGVYRVDVAAAALRAFGDRPFTGWGMGAFEDAIPAYKRAHGDVRVRHAESDIIELLVEGGLVALALAGWTAVWVRRGLRDRVTASRDVFRNGLAIAAAGGALTLLAHSFVDFNLRLPANALVFAALAGLAASPRTDPRPLGGRSLAAGVALLCLVLATGSVWRASGARRSEEAFAERDPVRRIAQLDDALASHPYSADMSRARAQAWRDLAWRPPRWDRTRLGRADADLQRALALRPRWGEAWADYGWVRAVQDDRSGARMAMERAIELDPTHLEVALAAANLLADQGDVAGALSLLGGLEGVHPGWTAARARALALRWTPRSVTPGDTPRR